MKKEIVIDGIQYRMVEDKPLVEKENTKFKVGDWVVGWSDSTVCRLNKMVDYEYFITSYCIVNDDNKLIPQHITKAHIIRLATPKEIENHLIEEAKRRGFIKGCTFNDLNLITKTRTCNDDPKFYYGNEDDLYIMNTNNILISCIYTAGKWAEIIKEEPIEIGGYDVKIEDKTISVGCKKYSDKFIYMLQNLAVNINAIGNVKDVNDVKSIKYDAYKMEFTIETSNYATKFYLSDLQKIISNLK